MFPWWPPQQGIGILVPAELQQVNASAHDRYALLAQTPNLRMISLAAGRESQPPAGPDDSMPRQILRHRCIAQDPPHQASTAW